MSEYHPTKLTIRGEDGQPSLVTLEILPHGLTIHRFIVWSDGKAHDIVVGPEAPQDHKFQKYTNSIIGRYTNRIPIGDYTIERYGIRSNLTPLPNENPRVCLHGGPKGFDVAEWTRLGANTDTGLFTQAELSEISKLNPDTYAIFRLVSADADQGFPGKLVVEVLVALIPPGGEEADLRPQDVKIGSVVLIYRAKLDEKGKKVVTPHWGFNLNASLDHRSLSVRNHNLTIRSDKVAELDKDQIPTGTFLITAEHGVHRHAGKKIGESFPVKGYDDFYLFEDKETFPPSVYSLDAFHSDTSMITSVLHPENERPVVELSSELSGIKLCFQTNQHGVMFYSSNFSDPEGARKIVHGGTGIRGAGDSYGPTNAVFLEFHNPLAAFLFPINANKQDTLLTSEEIYHNYVRCDVYFSTPKV